MFCFSELCRSPNVSKEITMSCQLKERLGSIYKGILTNLRISNIIILWVPYVLLFFHRTFSSLATITKIQIFKKYLLMNYERIYFCENG